ncbi:head-tail connector protein [Singulisphaera sp. PoT]|uniref:head-tail connector protein n=1 Tax=Singulisphaera sp. PoT TaxID=3411797 RepID=UPI003BF4A342
MLKLITQPSEEPVTLERAKLHLKDDVGAEDELIQAWIKTARRRLENAAAMSFVSTGWRFSLEGFPFQGCRHETVRDLERGNGSGLIAAIPLPRAPLVEVTRIRYVDAGGTLQTLDPSAYQVGEGPPGVVAPAYGLSWPSARIQFNAVQIEFTAGYGTADDVPDTLKSAILLFVSHLAENRGDNPDDIPIPSTVWDLLASESWGASA